MLANKQGVHHESREGKCWRSDWLAGLELHTVTAILD